MSAYGQTKSDDLLRQDQPLQGVAASGTASPTTSPGASSPAHAPGDDDPDTDIVTQITGQRGPMYGPFINNAIVAQRIKQAMRLEPSLWEKLDADIQEGLEQFALKISRIVTGDPLYLDNWDDIGGYAKIVADRIRKSQAKKGKAHA